MNKALTRLLLIVAIPSFAICSLAFAEMTGGTYTINIPTVSGGGNADMSGGTYHMYDLKGQGVIGEMRVVFFFLGLGGIYGAGTGESRGEIVVGAEDNGLIYDTTITRDEAGRIRLNWRYREGSGVRQADVWRLAGSAIFFHTDTIRIPGWSIVGTVALDATTFIEVPADPIPEGVDGRPGGAAVGPLPVVVGDGQNAYYRVVPMGTARASIFGNDLASGRPYNNRTVGKMDLLLDAGGKKLVCLPMYAGSIESTLVGQIPIGQELYFYPQSGRGLTSVTYYSTGSLSGTFNLTPKVGFWVINDNNPKVISFLGSFETSGVLPIATKDLTGNPVPFALSGDTLGGDEGDQIYPQSGRGLTSFTYSGGAWGGRITLNALDGFWFINSSGRRQWEVHLYDGATRINTTL